MSIKVRGGTPYHGGNGLCHSCKFSHVFRGAADSDTTVFCHFGAAFNPLRIHKPIVECSDYANKLEKDKYELEKIAWVLATKNGKPIGFISSREARFKSKSGDIDKFEDDDL